MIYKQTIGKNVAMNSKKRDYRIDWSWSVKYGNRKTSGTWEKSL